MLTGFLGAGKTTLLNRLLKRPELANTAVLINEFGEVGLDHLLVDLDGRRRAAECRLPLLHGSGDLEKGLRDVCGGSRDEFRRSNA